MTDSWHLDKRVPIVTIFVLLSQVFAFAWFASSMDSRVHELERGQTGLMQARLDLRMAVEESHSTEFKDKFIDLDDRLDRLEGKIDKIAERVGATK